MQEAEWELVARLVHQINNIRDHILVNLVIFIISKVSSEAMIIRSVFDAREKMGQENRRFLNKILKQKFSPEHLAALIGKTHIVWLGQDTGIKEKSGCSGSWMRSPAVSAE